MTVREICQYGDPVLLRRAAEVVNFDDALRTLVLDLWETMERAGGVGLAAPQIGVPLRVFVYHCAGSSGHVVNPRTEIVGDVVTERPEGCLSVSGRQHPCRRGAQAASFGRNLKGEAVEVYGTRVLARVLQHETDHLDGVLYLHRLEPVARRAAERVLVAGGDPDPGEGRRRSVLPRRWRRSAPVLGGLPIGEVR